MTLFQVTTNTLLSITIGLLIVFICLIGYLIIKSKRSGFSKQDIKSIIDETKNSQFKDYLVMLNEQTKEIQALKVSLNERLISSTSDQQLRLSSFLSETKSKLDAVEQSFSKESLDTKYQTEKNIKELIEQTSKEIMNLKENLIRELNEVNTKKSIQQTDEQLKTHKEIELQIDKLKVQVKETLESGFTKNEEAIQSFIEKTASIEASTRQIEQLKTEINRFNDLLSNQKSRGNFGEDVLNRILENLFGFQTKSLFYETQVSLVDRFRLTPSEKNEKLVVDFLFKIKTNQGILPLPIDAKFPYTNYVTLFDEQLSVQDRLEAKKRFRNDMKARINEVKRYVIESHTAPYAIMFIPAEAVFIDLFKEFPDLIEDARNKHIVIASPNLIVSLIQILTFILRDYELRNNQNEILELINGISKQFDFLKTRMDEHVRLVSRLHDSAKKLDITSSKLSNEFQKAQTFIDEKQSTNRDIIIEEEGV